MPRHLPAALAVAAVLLTPAAADAKGIATLSVCGPGGCVDRTAVALHAVQYPEQLLGAGMPVSDDAVSAGPFVRIRMGIGDGTRNSDVFARYTIALLPRSGFLQSEDGSWGKLQGSDLRAFRRVARGVPRFQGTRLRLVSAAPTPARTPAEPVEAAAVDGGTPAWPWVAGGVVALVVAAIALVRRRTV